MNDLIEVEVLEIDIGKRPFEDWYRNLDKGVRRQVLARLSRVKAGNFGDYKRLSSLLWELRFRSGLRIYYTMRGSRLVIVAGGGNKTSQRKDIPHFQDLIEIYARKSGDPK
ncbi:MAG: type II toxin-antitoxin system RelE/ParE family toxin [bacterium]|nr:type II toxin-antitoxin system RelE/ParE family toxin [bacterium]